MRSSRLQLKYAVLLVALLCTVRSQRPWHAGTSGRLPQVLPQYLDEQAAAQATQATQTTAQGAQGAAGGFQGALGPLPGAQGAPGLTASGVDATLANRIDGSDVGFAASFVPTSATPIATTVATIPLDLPVDAHGDVDLVNRIKTWPRDKQPFWYINWQAIQAHRGDQQQQQQQTQPQPNPTSFFAG